MMCPLRHIAQCFVLVCMPEHVGYGLNMCKQMWNVWNWSFIPWPWAKQDHGYDSQCC